MKEQDKVLVKQLSDMKIGNLHGKEFRVIIVKLIQDLGKRMEAQMEKVEEMFNKDQEELKNKQTEISYIMTEMKKNILEGINNNQLYQNGEIMIQI